MTKEELLLRKEKIEQMCKPQSLEEVDLMQWVKAHKDIGYGRMKQMIDCEWMKMLEKELGVEAAVHHFYFMQGMNWEK